MTRSTRLVGTIFAALVALLVTSSLAHATTIVRRSSRYTPFRVGTMTGLYVGFSIKNDSLNGFGPWSEDVDIWVALENFTQLSGTRMPTLAANEDGYYHIGPVAAGETFYVFFYLDWPYGTDPVDPTDPLLTPETFSAEVALYDRRPSLPDATRLAYSKVFEWDAHPANQANPNKVVDLDGDGLAINYDPPQPVVGSFLTVTVEGVTGTVSGNSDDGGFGQMIFSPAGFPEWPADVFELASTEVTFYVRGTFDPATGICATELIDTDSDGALDSCPAGGARNPVVNSLLAYSLTNVSVDYIAEYRFRVTGETPQIACTQDSDCLASATGYEADLTCNEATGYCGTQISPTAFIRSGQPLKHTFADDFFLLPPVPAPINLTSLDKLAVPTFIDELDDPLRQVSYTVTLFNESTTTVYLDDISDTFPTGATYVPGSSTYLGLPITDPTVDLANGLLVWNELFEVPPGDGVVPGEAVLAYELRLYGGVVDTITVTNALNATLYEVDIDLDKPGEGDPAITIGYTSDGDATASEIATGLAAAINADPALSAVLTATAHGNEVLLVAVSSEAGFYTEEIDDNLSLARAAHTNSVVAHVGDTIIDKTLTTFDFEPAETTVFVQLCGNLIIEGDEECDDGNEASGDGCGPICLTEGCGDGVVQPLLDEECDDRGESATCDADCTFAVCGDDTLNTTFGEECDDGTVTIEPLCAEDGACNSDTEPDACRTTCVLPDCGDEVIDTDEDCDDGGESSDCDLDCTDAFCGDFTVNATRGEDCDSGGVDAPTCDADCSARVCGDDYLNTAAGEECDDGTLAIEPLCADDGACNSDTEPDACRTTCLDAYCGDEVIDTDEDCDDGAANSDTAPDACRTTCDEAFCGDDVLDSDEECDDGVLNDWPDPEYETPDACRAPECIPAYCGDGVVDSGELCDPGSDPECRDDCSPVSCGDGILDDGEECDCGDEVDELAISGCDQLNSNEAPDACRLNCTDPRCGDGVEDTGEECDEGPENSDERPDACRRTCVPADCGDGVTDTGEECDQGEANSDTTPDACRELCVLPDCGDDIVDSGEECDDGTANSDEAPNACRTTCELPDCGDGVIDSGEICDYGDDNSDVLADACRTDCVPAHCGDGVEDTGEACDKGDANSDELADACRTTCVEAFCGDGVTDTGEECDDGNEVEGDGCRLGCILEFCGDGLPGPGEQCDDANDVDDDDCDNACQLPFCGNGVLNPLEECDDGNASNGDGCNVDCQIEQGWICDPEIDPEKLDPCYPNCGDGLVVADEECDDGNGDPGDGCHECLIETGWACDYDETLPGSVCFETCGDGVLDEHEECDDGGLSNGDGCAFDCKLEAGWSCAFDPDTGAILSCDETCGDGLVVGDEACDDDNLESGDGCSALCVLEVCGDGTLHESLGEQCDDGNTDDGDGCTGDCVIEFCGDGVVQDAVEDCDDGNDASGDGCFNCQVESQWVCYVEDGVSVCERLPECGDGEVHESEECDDGNTDDDDGCSAECELEEGWSCEDEADEESECDPIYGDGLVVGEEACDDGNDAEGDGCSDGQVEDGWLCDGEPSRCSLELVCGDGDLDEGEQCDDGNERDVDGCSSECEIEEGWICSGEPSVCGADSDGDGIIASEDNCPDVENPDQADLDGDGRGDVCDDDMDGDGLTNDEELALGTDPMNPDSDRDGVRDDIDPTPIGPPTEPEGCECGAAGSRAGGAGLMAALVALLGLALFRRRRPRLG